MTTHRRSKLPGLASVFRGKVRKPVSLTLTPKHHDKLRLAIKRLEISRAEVITLLIEMHADALMPYDVARFRGADDPEDDPQFS